MPCPKCGSEFTYEQDNLLVCSQCFHEFDSAEVGAEDKILMDMQMPEMGGVEATIKIREKEGEGQHTPIVALTAGALTEEREKCLEAGMDEFLTKPIEHDKLDSVITHFLSAGR